MNFTILIGRLGADPDIRYIVNEGKEPFCTARFSLAITAKSRGEKITEWYSIRSNGVRASFAEKYFKKGMRVAVHGHLAHERFTTKDGVDVDNVIVMADSLEFADGPRQALQDPDQPQKTYSGSGYRSQVSGVSIPELYDGPPDR